MRQEHEALGEEALLFGRRDERVGEDEVVAIRAQGPGEADAVDLDRRRPEREDVAAGVQHVAVGVDEDGDAIVADALHDRFVALAAHVGEVIESALEARPRCAAVVGAQGIAEHLDAGAIVPFDHLGQEVGQRVRPVVGAGVAHAQPALFAIRGQRRQGGSGAELACAPSAGPRPAARPPRRAARAGGAERSPARRAVRASARCRAMLASRPSQAQVCCCR